MMGCRLALSQSSPAVMLPVAPVPCGHALVPLMYGAKTTFALLVDPSGVAPLSLPPAQSVWDAESSTPEGSFRSRERR